MEVLDVLERRVTELLAEVTALRARNFELESRISAGAPAESCEEALRRVAELTEVLEEEKKHKEAVFKRIDSLVRRLEPYGGAG
ncbi:MAG: cell division protein ZapB [Deltaproteobacteria bacterium]|jgi:cell division protein ZapB|nr:cell division protein ZapB [Deltaproteobacteria bacterium]